jgi:hypothetical protein
MRPQEPTSPHLVSFGGVRPLALTKRQAVAALGSCKLVARMLWASRYAGDPRLVIARNRISTAESERCAASLLTDFGNQKRFSRSKRIDTRCAG